MPVIWRWHCALAFDGVDLVLNSPIVSDDQAVKARRLTNDSTGVKVEAKVK